MKHQILHIEIELNVNIYKHCIIAHTPQYSEKERLALVSFCLFF